MKMLWSGCVSFEKINSKLDLEVKFKGHMKVIMKQDDT